MQGSVMRTDAQPAIAANHAGRQSWSSDSATEGGAGAIQFINFAIGEDSYGIDIMAVREIKEWTEITTLPNQPEYVRGVLNLRGVIVPIIDLRCRFGQGMTEATPLHVVIIVQIGAQLIGLLADGVSDIISIDPTKIKNVPKVVQSAHIDFLSGIVTIERAMIALIDLPTLLQGSARSVAVDLAVNVQ